MTGHDILNLRSLAYMTDLSIISFQGRVENKGTYIVAESIGNPGYFWGNLLLLKSPPQTGDFQKWISLFKSEFSHQPLIKHITFGWDSPEATPGEMQDFIQKGFKVEKSIVLTLKRENLVIPNPPRCVINMRHLEGDDDWQQALQNQAACRSDDLELESYLLFKKAQMRQYRDMSEVGLGKWYGAFSGDKLVADCGLFIFDKIGRFQNVGTHPDFRNRGICGNLIHQVSSDAFTTGKADTLVMVADPSYHAARVYETIGFKPTEKQIGICCWPL